MSMSAEERFRKVVNGMKQGAAQELKHQLREAAPPAMSEFFDEEDGHYIPEGEELHANPDEEGEWEEGDWHEDDGEEGEDYSLSFEMMGQAEYNLGLAAAAWRMLSEYTDDVVAQYEPTGITFFGRPEDLTEYCEQRDMNDRGKWKVYDSDAAIKAIPAEMDAFQEVLDQLNHDDEWRDKAEEQFEAFHWGDKPASLGVNHIPGLAPDARPYLLGVGRRCDYGAKKEGKWEEYYHMHGEESGEYPMFYGLGDNVVIIYGGNMKVSPRGIID